jgi:hypothetical protein
MLDDFQALGQECRIAVVETNVVSGRGSGVESHCLADDECNGFGLGLAYDLGGDRTPLGAV